MTASSADSHQASGSKAAERRAPRTLADPTAVNTVGRIRRRVEYRRMRRDPLSGGPTRPAAGRVPGWAEVMITAVAR
jgi:hypothetical protein